MGAMALGAVQRSDAEEDDPAAAAVALFHVNHRSLLGHSLAPNESAAQ